MIYLDNGATTFPKPPSVLQAVSRALQTAGGNPGRGGHPLAIRAGEVIYACRKTAAKLFDAENPESIIFTDSCTTALNIVLHGLLRQGDHVVMSSLEHNAVARPLAYLQEHRGVSVSVAEVSEGDDDQTLDHFRAAFNEKTRLVVCTAASNVFGLRLPVARLAALCRMYGILFCVDAAQAAGLVPLHLQAMGIDFLCAPGHKGLYGPMGTGVLAVNTDRLPQSLTQGGTGSASDNLHQPLTLPDRYESGTPNLPGIAGLNEGMRFVLAKGEERLLRQELALTRRLYDGLSRIPGVVLYTAPPQPDTHVPVTAFNVQGYDSEETAALLSNRFQISVRAGLHCAPMAHRAYGTVETGAVRAVPSVYTKPAQVDYFIAAVNKIAKLLAKKVAIE